MSKKLIYLLCWLMLLTGCHSPEQDSRRLQQTLQKEQLRAMALTDLLSNGLHGNSFDSIRLITQDEPSILFYVFDRNGMVYWSDNWLAGDEVFIHKYDAWYYQRFSNAHCVCRWTYTAPYNILTVIPIRYAYPFENKQLRNSYIAPFNGSNKNEINVIRKEQSAPVLSIEGSYLFSVVPVEKNTQTEVEQTRLAESFSYQALLTTDNPVVAKVPHIRFYFILELLLYVLVVLIGIIGLIRTRGFSNMRLGIKVFYVINTLILLASIYIFTVATLYTRQHYQEQQQQVLQRKTVYIQKALQDSYFWNISLSEKNTVGMNIDLRDLSITYETDIQVYDLAGNLIGSSTPALFDKGLISRHIAPEPFFSKQATLIRHEKIGDLEYLSSYTEFFNGNYVQIGYIAVPLFISSDEVSIEVENFLSRLLPPNLIVLLLSFIISFFVLRSLTQPLSALSDKMKHFQIGNQGNRLVYNNNDEIGELVARYNEMVDELERSSAKLATSEREGAWRTMARQIAHEINNPLTPMKLTIQQLRRTKQIGDERFNEYFEKSTNLLIEQIDNLSKIAQSFSQFAKMPEVVTAEVDIAQKLYSVITLFRNNSADIDIRYIGAVEGVHALADNEQISQVFNNLIKNALQAIGNKNNGNIIVMLKELENTVEISVSDNGCGIPDDIKDKVFSPNFTTKNTGMGLGLAISKNIVESCGGTIRFETSQKGTTFFVLLKKTITR